MPTFCRHNRLVQNCPICAREQHVEMRPVVSPSGSTRAGSSARSAPRPSTRPRSRSGSGRSPGVTVRRLERGSDDGYRSALVRGLKSSLDAERLADELAWATARLAQLGAQPPGLYAEVAD